MSWWRNDDPRDDDNEADIKFVLALSYIVVILAGALVFTIMLSGCTHRFEDFKCKCDCKGKSTLECSASEIKTRVDGR